MIELLLYLTFTALLYYIFCRYLNTISLYSGYETDGIIARKKHQRILTPTRRSRKNIQKESSK